MMTKEFNYTNTNIEDFINRAVSCMTDEDLDNVIYDYIEDDDNNIDNLDVHNINAYCLFYMSLAESVNRVNVDMEIIDIYENLRNISCNKRYKNKKALSFTMVLNNILFNKNINLYNIELKDKDLYEELNKLMERQGLL